MVIYLYSVPALLALFTKLGLLVYAWRSPLRDIRTRLLVCTIIISLTLNLVEIGILQKSQALEPQTLLLLYYVVITTLLALLAHLTVKVTFESLPRWIDVALPFVIYGYAGVVLTLTVFSQLIVAGYQVFGGYTYTRIPGPLFVLFEIFALAVSFSIMLLPLWGLRTGSNGRARSRCRIWMIAAAPSAAVGIVVVTLLHFNIRWFNSSVTLPIPMALLLIAIAYCLYGKAVIDPAWYLPFSRIRKQKSELYEKLSSVSREAESEKSIPKLLKGLEAALQCPVSLLTPDGTLHSSSEQTRYLAEFPRDTLDGLENIAVTEDASPGLRNLMKEHGIGAIAPLFPSSEKARSWLFFGEAFGRHIYTPADYRTIDRVIRGLAGTLLDSLAISRDENRLAVDHGVENSTASDYSLGDRLANYETLLIREALKSCDGNQAKAAKLLGLQRNTLHYKLKKLKLTEGE